MNDRYVIGVNDDYITTFTSTSYAEALAEAYATATLPDVWKVDIEKRDGWTDQTLWVMVVTEKEVV